MPKPAETKLLICVQHRFDQWRFPEWLVEALHQRYPELKVVYLSDYASLDAEIPDTDIFIGWSLRPEQFARAQRLRWIHVTAAGVDHLLRHDICGSPVLLTNASGVMTVPMAEHTLGLILALARRLPSAVRAQQRHEWAQQLIWDERPHPLEINARTLLIVGYGAIGRELARRARACGMRIVGVKRDPGRGADHADRLVTPAELLNVLPEADFVVLATPVTSETRHAFGPAQFAAMKPTAYFINVGRGVLVDEAALVEALRAGAIAGAALDVVEHEPLPPESPLWDAPNLLLTPHLSAVSERLWHRHAALLLENLDRYFSGRELLNVVDKQRGY